MNFIEKFSEDMAFFFEYHMSKSKNYTITKKLLKELLVYSFLFGMAFALISLMVLPMFSIMPDSVMSKTLLIIGAIYGGIGLIGLMPTCLKFFADYFKEERAYYQDLFKWEKDSMKF